jgi:hypothetical protein
MDKEGYIQNLENINNYCSCQNLSKLFEKRRKAESLEKRCNFFSGNADLENPKPEDKAFLLDYKKNAENLKKLVSEYYRELENSLATGELKLVIHDDKRYSPIKEIDSKEAKNLLKDSKEKPIITIHCSKCNQQIDLAG